MYSFAGFFFFCHFINNFVSESGGGAFSREGHLLRTVQYVLLAFMVKAYKMYPTTKCGQKLSASDKSLSHFVEVIFSVSFS